MVFWLWPEETIWETELFVIFHWTRVDWFKATQSSGVPLKLIDARRKRSEFPFRDCGATSSAYKLTHKCSFLVFICQIISSLTCFGTILWPAASEIKIIGGIFREMCEKRPPERQWVPGLRPAVCDPVWWCISAAGTVSPGPCAANWRKRLWTTISCGWPHWNCCCCRRYRLRYRHFRNAVLPHSAIGSIPLTRRIQSASSNIYDSVWTFFKVKISLKKPQVPPGGLKLIKVFLTKIKFGADANNPKYCCFYDTISTTRLSRKMHRLKGESNVRRKRNATARSRRHRFFETPHSLPFFHHRSEWLPVSNESRAVFNVQWQRSTLNGYWAWHSFLFMTLLPFKVET